MGNLRQNQTQGKESRLSILPVKTEEEKTIDPDRRKVLLHALRELLRIEEPEAVTFAKVCARAEIPRASAYHFFPNMGAMYLGLRLVHADLVSLRLEKLKASDFVTWQDYVRLLAKEAASVVREDRALLRVVYGVRSEETKHIGKTLDSTIVNLALAQVEEQFVLPNLSEMARKFAIAVSLIDSVFRYSYREGGDISDEMVNEAGRAAIAYLRCYLPEYLNRR
ncbi:TetR/AcrR family transcriptional regulator [Leptospira congkakensis]|uniref:TetR/AcrR family transcriptional regulator n=1 Tax=Leptospira congkakensis TaxID=2484932 RepID=A0A4Z1A7K7_9LEPT|nr:TetR/AcrR family transcriptional regulator [Leptospira congkakensis]TGL90663.1 TetR/AcrR family transcriptional regulator [Leptospira congkakensis]TGL91670.1 TetR/AcrR family transcriptional regulator [Leptospira congkakensis]TGL98722.1 TetR/AcrR family transcriptional regulator [Leptospira congkakensis]